MRTGVIAVVTYRNRYILIHKPNRPATEWTLPGGGMEGAESPEDAFVREVGEELGLEPNEIGAISTSAVMHEFDFPPEFVRKTGYTGQRQHVVFGTARETAMPRPDLDEIDGIWFVSREAFIEAIAFDDLRETIRRALEER